MGLFDRVKNDATPHASHTAGVPTTLRFDLRNLWRAVWVVLGAFAVISVAKFVTGSAGTAIFQIIMALFLAMAMEPLVGRLAKHMRRGFATAIVMLGLLLAVLGFMAAFGSLLVSEFTSLIQAIPGVATDTTEWVNKQFGTHYDLTKIASNITITPEKAASYGTQLAGGVFGILGGVFGLVFGAFVLLFFAFYVSAGMPKLRDWIASLFPPKQQSVVLTVWDLLLTKVGGYVSARFVLAAISATAHGAFMFFIGMPYYLALGLWTGLIAQFIPNVGTYISITLPVLVGLTSDNPRNGIFVLIFAIVYQQIENLTIEPNISARAVDVHPAVSFAAALMGAQMFGLAGGVLGVPLAATAMALLELYKKRYEIDAYTADAAEQLAKEAGTKKSDSDDDSPREHTEAADEEAGSRGASHGDRPVSDTDS